MPSASPDLAAAANPHAARPQPLYRCKRPKHEREPADGQPPSSPSRSRTAAQRAAASPWRASRERQRDREVKREAVIRAAAHAFNRKGYHNTSLDDIAAALEVTKPTVYYYVTNKEQLLFECFVAGVEQIRAAFREVQAAESPGARATERRAAPLRRGRRVRVRLVHGARRGAGPVAGHEQPHQGAEVGNRPGHPPADPRRHPGRLHPSLRSEDDRVRAGRLAQLDRPLVPREPVDDRGAEIADAFITVFDNGLQPRAQTSAAAHAGHRGARQSLNLSRGSRPCQTMMSSSFRAKRTPIGAFQGALAPVTATQLGSAAVKAAIESAGLEAGRHPGSDHGLRAVGRPGPGARRDRPRWAPAFRSARRPTTINKMCGSGLKAVMMAADQIRAGDVEIVLAGGLESMTNAPYLLPKARGGYRMGHGEILDHMFYDGLQSPFDGKAMGCFADATAAKYNFTRAAQDAFAAESVRRAHARS